MYAEILDTRKEGVVERTRGGEGTGKSGMNAFRWGFFETCKLTRYPEGIFSEARVCIYD